jgi:hypothetical protein
MEALFYYKYPLEDIIINYSLTQQICGNDDIFRNTNVKTIDVIP